MQQILLTGEFVKILFYRYHSLTFFLEMCDCNQQKRMNILMEIITFFLFLMVGQKLVVAERRSTMPYPGYATKIFIFFVLPCVNSNKYLLWSHTVAAKKLHFVITIQTKSSTSFPFLSQLESDGGDDVIHVT